MTYFIKHFVGIAAYGRGDKERRRGFFGTKAPLLGDWGWFGDTVYTYLWGAHVGHLLEFLVALLCYALLYADGSWLLEAREWRLGWVSRIFLFNLTCEVVLCNFWHWLTYCSTNAEPLHEVKFNPENQYEPNSGKVGMFGSSTGQLEREITFNTLGWLQSAAWQCLFTYLWAHGDLSFYADFWSRPAYSVLVLFGVTYWREVHFYMAHRGMHPWFDKEAGLLQGDVGAFLYRHVHSLHHKSYNPGPWSGLCMHPVEHFLYYSCATLLPLIVLVHPLHFLYAKFHADIAPIGGHDGHEEPGGNGDFHWLHHAKFECNYGVPWPINLDKLFGTWAEYPEYKETGVVRANGAWANAQMHAATEEKKQSGGVEEPLLLGAKEGQDGEIAMEEVARHKSRGDCWLALYGQVLDVSAFLAEHPGGEGVLFSKAGGDATKVFEGIHASSGGFDLVRRYAAGAKPLIAVLGAVRGYAGPAPPAPSAAAAAGGLSCGYPGALLLYPVFAAAAVGAFTHAAIR